MMVVHNPLINKASFLGGQGGIGGVPLDSHENWSMLIHLMGLIY